MNIVQGLILGFLALSYISGTIVAMTILLENRDPSKTVTWLLIFILLPGVGLIIYAVFGRNLRKIKIFKTQELASNMKEEKLFRNLDEINNLIRLEQDTISVSKLLKDNEEDNIKLKIISLLLNTGMFPFTTNNKVDIFVDGNEKFERLIKDIENAKDHIHLEYFIIKDSDIGQKIKNLLIKKSKENVKIKILYDDVGCWRFWFHREFFNEMKSHGIEIVPFLPTKFPIIGGKLNYRNHRKIVVIDG
ncbi:MAG: PLDc N-terminal domain-containing protein, partial [Peptostreptococcaceae bacterium]|nr:PLDc N-terminal domain-containing protein [Peptostreptococcaceae bacterium]